MKWGVPTFGEGKFYFVALKEHVNLGFSLKGLSKEEQDMFEGSGKTMKHLKIGSLADIDEKKIVDLLKLVWQKNKQKQAQNFIEIQIFRKIIDKNA